MEHQLINISWKAALLSLLLLIGSSSIVVAQSKNAFLKSATEALTTKDFHSALAYFKEVLRFDSSQVDIIYQAAEAARNFNSYTQAEKLYEQVLEMDSSDTYPDVQFHLADMKQRLGKYDEAKDLYTLYVSESEGEVGREVAKARNGIMSTEWALEASQAEREDVEIGVLGGVNTPYSEFGAYKVGDELYYSSLRFEREGNKKEPTKLYSKILKQGESSEGEPQDDQLNDPTRHTAHSAFNKEGNRIYYTVCDYINSTDIQCDLYYRDYLEGQWGEPVLLPAFINIDSTTSTQPTLSYDEETEKETLYYVSDRDDGKGGLDIWSTEINKDGTFSQPTNLQPINTSYDDITPYFHDPTQTLYFSSDGRKGLGGFDVFKSKLYSADWGEVTNMGTLINTSYNDLYFFMEESGDNGMLSSNRLGSQFLETSFEACCYDIYDIKFLANSIELLAFTFDRNTRDSLIGSTVTLYDLTDPNADPVMMTNLEGHDFVFPLESGKDYKVIAEKEGYDSDSLNFNTREIFKNEKINKNLFLKKQTLDLDLLTFDKQTLEPLIGTTVTLIDMSDSLNSIQTFTNPTANNYLIPLIRGKNYKIIVSKKGYAPETLAINTDEFDDQNTVSRKVYLDRGDLESFLPLILFYDNDQPNPNSWSKRTDSSYTSLFDAYYNRKEEFIANYIDSGQVDDEVTLGFESFFEDRLLKGRRDLDEFLQIVIASLRRGESIEVVLKGYTSPLHTAEYNFRLGQRRVNNVKNQILRYEDGALKEYIDSGLFKISEQSFGETTSPPDISDDGNDKRNSIYGIPASNERRVEIVQVKRSEN